MEDDDVGVHPLPTTPTVGWKRDGLELLKRNRFRPLPHLQTMDPFGHSRAETGAFRQPQEAGSRKPWHKAAASFLQTSQQTQTPQKCLHFMVRGGCGGFSGPEPEPRGIQIRPLPLRFVFRCLCPSSTSPFTFPKKTEALRMGRTLNRCWGLRACQVSAEMKSTSQRVYQPPFKR